MTAPRVECHVCGAVRQVKLEFAGQKRRLTRAMERYVLELSRLTTIDDVAQHLHLSWDTVKDLQAEHLRRRFSKPKLKRLTVLEIDEIAVGKGHSFLCLAWLLKEELRMFWQQESREHAAAFLESWIGLAEASGIEPLEKMAKTLLKHWDGLLTWYDYPISNGPLEGTNNKIQTMKRQAYGLRYREFYKLKILGIHEAKYALVG